MSKRRYFIRVADDRGFQRHEVWARVGPRNTIRVCEIACGGRGMARRVAAALNAHDAIGGTP